MTTSTASPTPAGHSAPLAPMKFNVDPFPTNSHYYAITADDGRPLAVLFVLLDSHMATTRAELYYYEDGIDRSTHDAILRRARNIIGTDYLGGSGLSTDLSVTRAIPQAPVSVEHENGAPNFKEKPTYALWKFVVPIAAVLIVVVLVGFFLNRYENRTSEDAMEPVAVVERQTTEPVATQSDSEVAAVQVSAPEGVDPASLQPNTNGLPASVNADPGLAPGVVAVMGEGYNSFIRSLPGAEAGEGVGYLQPGDRVTIIGGPTWLKGDSDTIVWWYVRAEDGVTGWAPANTSTLTLLEVAP